MTKKESTEVESREDQDSKIEPSSGMHLEAAASAGFSRRKGATTSSSKPRPHKKPSGNRRTRKKPKEAPQRPLSGYNYFFREQRNVIIEERKSSSEKPAGSLFETLGKEIASRWKALDKEARTKYEEQADEDMKRYRKEMSDYNDMLAQRTKDEKARRAAEAASKPSVAVHKSQQNLPMPARLNINSVDPSPLERQLQLSSQLLPYSSHARLGELDSLLYQRQQDQLLLQQLNQAQLARAADQLFLNQLARRQQMQAIAPQSLLPHQQGVPIPTQPGLSALHQQQLSLLQDPGNMSDFQIRALLEQIRGQQQQNTFM